MMPIPDLIEWLERANDRSREIEKARKEAERKHG